MALASCYDVMNRGRKSPSLSNGPWSALWLYSLVWSHAIYTITFHCQFGVKLTKLKASPRQCQTDEGSKTKPSRTRVICDGRLPLYVVEEQVDRARPKTQVSNNRPNQHEKWRSLIYSKVSFLVPLTLDKALTDETPSLTRCSSKWNILASLEYWEHTYTSLLLWILHPMDLCHRKQSIFLDVKSAILSCN